MSRPEATAPIPPLVWELPYAVGMALKKQKRPKKPKNKNTKKKKSFLKKKKKNLNGSRFQKFGLMTYPGLGQPWAHNPMWQLRAGVNLLVSKCPLHFPTVPTLSVV